MLQKGFYQGAVLVNEGSLSVSMMAERKRGLIELESVLISKRGISGTTGALLD